MSKQQIEVTCSSEEGSVEHKWTPQTLAAKLVYKLTTKDGWLGDYNYAHMFTPDIWPLNKKYKDFEHPFFAVDEELPILLMLILGFQHAFTLIGSLVAVPLIFGSELNFTTSQTQHLISCTLITGGIATFAQITRFHIYKTPYYVGTGILSVVGPTFDILGIAGAYVSSRYEKGTCPSAADGTQLPCEDAFGAILGTMLCTVWVQVLMAFLPPKVIKRVFPTMVSGTLLLLLTVYLGGAGMKSWGGGSGCYGSDEGCTVGIHTYMWGNRRFIGLGFSVFVSIMLIEMFGAPIMKSSAIIFGLGIGCAIAGSLGYWDGSDIIAAPAGDFLWTKNYTYSVDGALVLPLLIMFCVEAVSCIPDIVATAEVSRLPIDDEYLQPRIQGGIMCDAFGSLLGAVGGGLPMVSQAANNGVVAITGCSSRYAGWTAAIILILMGVFSKIAATFATLPKTVFGGMQVYLYGTIGVAGLKVLSTVKMTRRNRFILGTGLGLGFAGAVVPDWFDSVLAFDNINLSLSGFLEGIELVVETNFILGATVVCFLNLVIPLDKEEVVEEEMEMV